MPSLIAMVSATANQCVIVLVLVTASFSLTAKESVEV